MSSQGWRSILGLPYMIGYARARLPARGYADVNLVISHKARRKHIDGWIAANLPDAETLTIGSDGGDAQDRDVEGNRAHRCAGQPK